MLGEAAKNLSGLYKELSIPVRLIAGSEDRIVETEMHSVRLHRELATSTLRVVPECGHMVHNAVPEEVVAAIATLPKSKRVAGHCIPQATVQRQWLCIGEGPVENRCATWPHNPGRETLRQVASL